MQILQVEGVSNRQPGWSFRAEEPQTSRYHFKRVTGRNFRISLQEAQSTEDIGALVFWLHKDDSASGFGGNSFSHN